MDAKKKEKLGTRWTCYSCGGAFYDLKKPEPICPRCSADQREQPKVEPAKTKRTRKKAAKKKKKPTINPKLVEEENRVETEPEEVSDLDFKSDDGIQVEVDND